MTLDGLQLTAFTIIRKNIWTLVGLILFVFAVGLKERDGALVPYTSWACLLRWAVLLPGLYFALLLVVRLLQDAADAKREQSGDVVFSGKVGWQLMLLSVVVLFVGLDVAVYRQGDRVPPLEIAVTVGFVLLAFYCWPRTIEFSNGSILQKKALGGTKAIPFADVLSARYDARQQSIIISGKNGITIVHSMFHAGQKQFVRRLGILTGTVVPGLTV
jgi:hypothetical protein